MTKPSFNATHLESLTTTELIRMADNLGIDMPPDLDRIFVMEELLEVLALSENPDDVPVPHDTLANAPAVPSAQEGLDGDTASDSFAPPVVQPEPLPERYNVTFIEVIVRDPLWAFVFWEMNTHDQNHFESNDAFEGFYLKVSPLSDNKALYTIPIAPSETSRYVGLGFDAPGNPWQTPAHQKQYKMELCAALNDSEEVLAASNSFTVPHLQQRCSGEEGQAFASDNPLIRLSGYTDIRILHTNERVPRDKGVLQHL